MSCLLVVHSDIGIKKSTNQDSVLAVKADTDMGESHWLPYAMEWEDLPKENWHLPRS